MARPDPYDTRGTSRPIPPADDPFGPSPAHRIGLRPAVTPAASAAAPPTADQLNAQYDAGGYGPHSTPAQADVARAGATQAPAATAGLRPSARPSGPPDPFAEQERLAQAVPPREFKSEQATNAGSNQSQSEEGMDPERQKYANFLLTGFDGYKPAAQAAIMGAIGQVMAPNKRESSSSGAQSGESSGQATGPPSDTENAQAMMRDPQTRAGFEVSHRVAPGTIPAPQKPGQSPYNAANYDQAGRSNPALAGPAAVLADETPIHEKAATFASFPDAQDPASQSRQLWDAYMAKQQARGAEFDREMGAYNPLDPNHPKAYDTSTPGAALGSIYGAAREGIFGPDPAVQRRNQEFTRHMGVLGYAPAQIGVRAGAPAAAPTPGVKTGY